jgi:hypothetical protein
MQQGPSKEEAKERLYKIAIFFGKDKADKKLNELMDAYYSKLDQMPIPKSRSDNTKYVLEWMNEMEEDPVIHEDKWWTRNSLYVAEASRTGWTKEEWKNLMEYLTNA